VPTENLIPGMLLAADVRDRNGRLLLKAGTELTDKHLYILRTWGTVEADIAGADVSQECTSGICAIDPEILAGIEAELTPLFRHTDLTHPAIRELLQIRIVREAGHGHR
jgi:hypothetical protein